jgi:hypothetical protein
LDQSGQKALPQKCHGPSPLAAQPSNAPEKVSRNPIDPERSRTPSAWTR